MIGCTPSHDTEGDARSFQIHVTILPLRQNAPRHPIDIALPPPWVGLAGNGVVLPCKRVVGHAWVRYACDQKAEGGLTRGILCSCQPAYQAVRTMSQNPPHIATMPTLYHTVPHCATLDHTAGLHTRQSECTGKPHYHHTVLPNCTGKMGLRLVLWCHKAFVGRKQAKCAGENGPACLTNTDPVPPTSATRCEKFKFPPLISTTVMSLESDACRVPLHRVVCSVQCTVCGNEWRHGLLRDSLLGR